MTKSILSLSAVMMIALAGTAQQQTFERFIMGTGGQITDTLDNGTVVTLDLSTDDVEQENDEVDSYYDDDLDTGWEGAPEDQNLLTLGLRFTDIQIPAGEIIDSAFIVFHAHEGKGAEDVAKLTIAGEAADNPLTFDETNFTDMMLLTDRPQTTAQAAWTVDEEWVIWQPYQTSDIGAIVQELIDRPGWASGNAMAFFLLPEDQGPSIVENAREFTSFENIADPDDVDPQGNPGDGTNHPERRPYIKVYYGSTNSIIEVKQDVFSIYPNPAADSRVQLNLNNSATANITISSIDGRVVKTATANGSTNINLEGLNSGMYLLEVEQNGASQTKTLIVE